MKYTSEFDPIEELNFALKLLARCDLMNGKSWGPELKMDVHSILKLHNVDIEKQRNHAEK